MHVVGLNANQGQDAFLAVSEEASTIQRQVTNEAATNIENLRSELMRQSAEKQKKAANETPGKAVVKRQMIRRVMHGSQDVH